MGASAHVGITGRAPHRLQPQACARCARRALVTVPQPRLHRPLSLPQATPSSSGSQDREAAEPDGEAEDGGSAPLAAPTPDEPQEQSAAVRAALAALRFYKSGISPLLQPACRYLPTCSEYAMDAYKRYGASKGTILTAWRLMRCNPWGGRGYDPVAWPPVGLERLFQ